MQFISSSIEKIRWLFLGCMQFVELLIFSFVFEMVFIVVWFLEIDLPHLVCRLVYLQNWFVVVVVDWLILFTSFSIGCSLFLICGSSCFSCWINLLLLWSDVRDTRVETCVVLSSSDFWLFCCEVRLDTFSFSSSKFVVHFWIEVQSEDVIRKFFLNFSVLKQSE